MAANSNGVGVVPQVYDYPGSVIECDCGKETSSPAHKGESKVGNTYAPVAPNTGPSQIYGS